MQLATQQRILVNEIETVADEIEISRDKAQLKEEAKNIGLTFLRINENANPVTVGRASFFIALRRVDPKANHAAARITNNNGHRNKWWFYLYPVIERTIESGKIHG